MENRTNMEDDRVAILETQLAQAKLIAEEADKKYEEVSEDPEGICISHCRLRSDGIVRRWVFVRQSTSGP